MGATRYDASCVRAERCRFHDGSTEGASVTATVIWPASLRGRKAQFEKDIDTRGRFTIPAPARAELGIDERRAVLPFIVDAIGEQHDDPFSPS